AEVKDFEPTDFMDRKTARNIGRVSQFGLAAAKLAVADARIDLGEMDPDDAGVIVASGYGGVLELLASHVQMQERGYNRVSPMVAQNMGVNMTSAIVAMHTRARGLNYSIVSACASSSHGIGEAAEIIRRGDARVMLAG